MNFRHELACILLWSYGMPSLQGRRPSVAIDDVCLDGKNHLITKGVTERCCELPYVIENLSIVAKNVM